MFKSFLALFFCLVLAYPCWSLPCQEAIALFLGSSICTTAATHLQPSSQCRMESPARANSPQPRNHCPLPSNGHQLQKSLTPEYPGQDLNNLEGHSRTAVPLQYLWRLDRKRKVIGESLRVLDNWGRREREGKRGAPGRDNWDGEGTTQAGGMETYIRGWRGI